MLFPERSEHHLAYLALVLGNVAQLYCAQKQGLVPYGPTGSSQIYWWLGSERSTNNSITLKKTKITVRLNTQTPRPCTAI